MKKGDYLIILLAFILVISVYTIYFIQNPLFASGAQEIEVRYQNRVVYTVDYKEGLDQFVELVAEDGILTITILQNGEVVSIQTRDVRDRGRTENTVHLLYGNVHMDEANCPDQYCMRMRITSPLSPPIVCTNGVTVMMVTMDIEITI
jgi:hypothetical protein